MGDAVKLEDHEDIYFWAACLEQAIDENGLDVIFDRANELYDSGDNEHD